MNQASSGILHAVAMPKQFLWAPFELAMINIMTSLCVMLLCIGVLGWTPFVSLVPLVGGHAMLVGLSAQNPHIFFTIRAIGKYPGTRKNIASPSVGAKFVP